MEKNERSQKIERIAQDFSRIHQHYTSGKSKVYSSFLQLMEEASKDGALTKKHKELMAVAIGLVLYCEHCLFYHVREAVKCGASDQEILETLHVAIEMGGGPAVIRSSFVLDVLEQVKNEAGATAP